mmetsp:Transcript_24686/g.52577  ORF Transcript_24686/g.52577 Transcript_24686/m.52577 type:complete len:426 (-) Transcript_24686:629-1906(-)
MMGRGGCGLLCGLSRGLLSGAFLLVVVVVSLRSREEAVAVRQALRGAQVHKGGGHCSVLGVTDPRRLTRGLQEGLGTQDDLDAGGDEDEGPLQRCSEDHDAHQLPRQVFAALVGTHVLHAGQGGTLRSCQLIFPQFFRVEATAMLLHVLHLVDEARGHLRVQARRGRDEPEVPREGRGDLPGAWPPLPAWLLGHVLLWIVGIGEVQHTKGHNEVSEDGQQGKAEGQSDGGLRVVIAVLQTAANDREERGGVAKPLGVGEAVLARAEDVQTHDQSLGGGKDERDRPHDPEAAQLRDGSAHRVVRDRIEERNDAIEHRDSSVYIEVPPLLLRLQEHLEVLGSIQGISNAQRSVALEAVPFVDDDLISDPRRHCVSACACELLSGVVGLILLLALLVAILDVVRHLRRVLRVPHEGHPKDVSGLLVLK